MVLEYPRAHDQLWKREVSQVGAGTSDPIILPGWVEKVSAAVILEGASNATVQYTLDPETEVDAAPGSADWVDWDAGAVSVDSGYPANSSITAVRIVTVGGGATLKVAGRRMAARVR